MPADSTSTTAASGSGGSAAGGSSASGEHLACHQCIWSLCVSTSKSAAWQWQYCLRRSMASRAAAYCRLYLNWPCHRMQPCMCHVLPASDPGGDGGSSTTSSTVAGGAAASSGSSSSGSSPSSSDPPDGALPCLPVQHPTFHVLWRARRSVMW